MLPCWSRRRLLRRGLVMLAALAAGRLWAQADLVSARALVIGEDRCPACNMAVIDARFAAQARTEGGRVLIYDALECLADHLAGHAGEVPRVTATHLADRRASSREHAHWLLAEDAVLLVHPALRTPMGGGLVVFAEEATAYAFADAARLPDAQLLRWAEVLERAGSRPWVPQV